MMAIVAGDDEQQGARGNRIAAGGSGSLQSLRIERSGQENRCAADGFEFVS